MIPPNSPRGDKKDSLSSFHENSPHPGVLKAYFEEKVDGFVRPLHPLLKELIKDIEKKVVLDLGCGLGSIFCQALLYYGLDPENLYSLDADPKNFEKDEYPRLNKLIGDAKKTTFDSNLFDVVHSNEMTLDNPHIDYIAILKEINRVLKPGGFYIANEHFKIIFHMKEMNSEIKKSNLPLLKIIENKKLLDELNFKPVIKIKYLDIKEKPDSFTFYIFQKNYLE